jgi:hypothetical protein
MSKKTITFNPDLLSQSGLGSIKGGRTQKKREKKEKPSSSGGLFNQTKIKKQLLSRIKDYQHKTSKDENTITDDEKEKIEFDKEFNNSLNFLEDLSKKHQTKNELKKKNKTLRNNNINIQVATELPIELISNTFLENNIVSKPSLVTTENVKPALVTIEKPSLVTTENVKPALVTINKPALVTTNVKPALVTIEKPILVTTENVKPAITINANPIFNQEPPYSNLKIGGNKQTYKEWKRNTQKNTSSIQSPENVKIVSNPKQERSIRKRITRTIKYKLGKKGDKVSILIKNLKTRKLVQHEQTLLKQKNILEVKNYLRKKNLIKVGSDAPPDILREIYECSILSGDVENKAKDVLIYNYMNDK